MLRRNGDGYDLATSAGRSETRLIRWPGHVTAFVDGRAHDFEISDPRAAEEDLATGDHIAAPMPGLVKLVRTAVGDDVKQGQVVAVLEAMKMEHTLTAPRDGRVAELRVTQGDSVSEGAILVTLEPGE